jgi:hypothetical protein
MKRILAIGFSVAVVVALLALMCFVWITRACNAFQP